MKIWKRFNEKGHCVNFISDTKFIGFLILYPLFVLLLYLLLLNQILTLSIVHFIPSAIFISASLEGNGVLLYNSLSRESSSLDAL